MSASDLRAQQYQVQDDVIAGWPVRVTSYRVGDRWFASVASVDPGAQIALAEAESVEEAVSVVRQKASERLAQTKRL